MHDVDPPSQFRFDGLVVVFDGGAAVEDGGELGADYVADAFLALGAVLGGGVAGGGASVAVLAVGGQGRRRGGGGAGDGGGGCLSGGIVGGDDAFVRWRELSYSEIGCWCESVGN